MQTKYTKESGLIQWLELEPNQPIAPHFEAIPYRAPGSKYGACGIRIDGSPAFIDAVLSRLQDIIECENEETRLEFARRQVEKVEINGQTKSFDNQCAGSHGLAEVCYIRRHERGREAQMANKMLAAMSRRVSE